MDVISVLLFVSVCVCERVYSLHLCTCSVDLFTHTELIRLSCDKLRSTLFVFCLFQLFISSGRCLFNISSIVAIIWQFSDETLSDVARLECM